MIVALVAAARLSLMKKGGCANAPVTRGSVVKYALRLW
jgi:hypothetical protein